jgi:hemerythrin-like domain-containing protein
VPIQIGQPADHGFDEPLGLLSDCHRRIEHFLGVLQAVATRAAGVPLTAEYRNALETALKYFSVAAPKHTADEDVSLFPRLRNSDAPTARDVLEALDNLQRDHYEADAHHRVVDELVRRWLADGSLTGTDHDELRARLTRLQDLYQQHIATEERLVFPIAARVLGRPQLTEIGLEMATRRGVVANVIPSRRDVDGR